MPTIFHGRVKRSNRWYRLVTGTQLFKDEEVLEEYNSGHYQPAFLEYFFSGLYRVESRKVNRKQFQGLVSDTAISSLRLLSSEVIRWSTDSDQHIVRIKGNEGWLTSFKNIGLIVGNSKKMSKRLAEIIRFTSAWLYSDKGSLKVEVIKHSYPDSYVDGISAISSSLAIRCIQSNMSASPQWVAEQIRDIQLGKTTIVSFRMLMKDGLIKGNALVLPEYMMNGYDVRTFAPNIKSELSTSGWQWVTIEPSYGAIPVKSDDITHAIYRPVTGLYDDATLFSSLNDMLQHFMEDLKEGKMSEWMTRLAEAENSSHEGIEKRFSSDHGLISLIQNVVKAMYESGVRINSSQTLMYLAVGGLKNQTLGNNSFGNVWKDKSRHWFPVPWAYSAHIMTKEVLEIFGFKMPKGDFGFYHKATHCFVVPGAFFDKHLADHGGPDLDDTFKVHIRIINNTLMAFLLRNPNDFGEWSIIPVREVGPVFHAYTDQPPVVDYYELFEAVPQFSWKKEELEIGCLPGTKLLTVGKVFSLEDESRVRKASQMFPAATGGAVIPKIIHYGCGGGYLPKYFASNEDIIDALQQGMATPDDIALIQTFVYYIFKQVYDNNNGIVDCFWFETRLPRNIVEELNFVSGKESESEWVNIHKERETVVRYALAEMTAWLNANIEEPAIMSTIQWTTQEIVEGPKRLDEIVKAKMKSTDWVSDFVKILEQSDANDGQEVTDRKIMLLVHQAFVAKEQYPRSNHDQWLYSFSVKSEKQPVDWFIRALRAYTYSYIHKD